MAWQFPLSRSYTSSVAVSLGTEDSVIVGRSVTLATTTQTTVYGSGSYQEARIHGTVLSSSAGVALGSGADSTGNRILVSETGYVEATGEFAAVGINATHSAVENYGTIIGYRVAVGMNLGKGEASALHNDGYIEADSYGVVRTGSGLLTFTNTGTVVGTTAYSGSLNAVMVATDRVINQGEMDGNVFLGAGNDLYDGRKGHIDGYVDGVQGNDKLYGGTEANTLAGGEGNDTLFGGKGNDTFVFDAALNASTNLDHIQDFANVKGSNEEICLDISVFTKLKEGALSGSHFKDLGVSGAKQDSNDFVVYNSKTGVLAYDSDGSGANKSVAFAILDNHAHLTAADFAVI